jgi:hypothetical protein
MAGFKRSQPGLQFSGEQVTADEQDDYNVYSIGNPGTSNIWFGTAPIGGTSSLGTVVITNRYPDYPRNLNYILVGTGAGMAGTFTAVGVDQFGSSISEVVATGTASNGGIVVGTAVFGRFDAGTVNFGTAVGNGTTKIGFVPGTGCLFGLPVKIAGTQDISLMSHVAGTGNVSYNGGTVAGFINTTLHAIRPAAAVTGTETINVWIKSSFNPVNIPKVANLKNIG